MKTNHYVTACLASLLCFGLSGSVRADDASAPPADSTSPQYGSQHERTGSMESTAPGAPTRFNKASKLIGMEVQNEQGENLGDIKDIVINLDRGTVSYAVLSSGGVLGVGEKLLAVPLTAFTRSADQKHLVLQTSKDNISKAESIGNNWPSVQNPSFGAMPFWQQKPGERNATPPATTPGQ